jgi:hypothetical protein
MSNCTVATFPATEVNFAQSIGLVTHRASGFLWSLSADKPSDERLAVLKPKLFRSRLHPWERNGRTGIESIVRMASMGARIQVVISDEYAWHFRHQPKQSWNGGFNEFGYSRVAHWPGDNGDYSLLDEVIRDCFERVSSRGLSVQWDFWEEPDFTGWWRPCREQFFAAWQRAACVLRELDPEAVLVGPSISRYKPDYLKAFLLSAKEAGALPDILSWHEIDPEGTPEELPGHVAEMRQFMTENDIEISRIDINEVISASDHTSPGATVRFFAALEAAEVEGACKACWMDEGGRVFNAVAPTLDGLLVPKTLEPRSVWWVHKAYAELSGTHVSVTPESGTAALASMNEADGVLRLLLGRDQSPQASGTIDLTGIDSLAAFAGRAQARLVVTHIPHSGWKALNSPQTIRDEVVSLSEEPLSLHFPEWGPEEALSIKLRPECA